MARLRHRVVWRMLRFPAAVFLWFKYRYTCRQAPRIPHPFILISNHVTDLDPLLVGRSFKQHMYFVASEHLYRLGFLSKLLIWLAEPIPRVKGSTDTSSAINIMRAIKNKSNVGLFAEGDKTWNGRTGRLHPTTGRLVKASRAALVTYKLAGGYLTSPRWSKSIRHGRMYGHMVNVYPPEQLQSMTAEEITQAINADIYEDAYEAQRASPVRYRGRDLASGLEYALYICPACKRAGTLKSSGDMFFCPCGLSVTYNEYGFFEGENRPFHTVAEWDDWQEQYLRRMADEAGDGPIYEDPGQSLWRIGADHSESLAASGFLRLFKDRLELGSFSVTFDKLRQMGIYGRANLVFSAEGANYEIKSEIPRNGRKYLTMFRILTETANRSGADAATL